jgi:hypothetical protein
MARHDGNGRNLKSVLTYILNNPVTDNDICTAIGVNRNSYYKTRRRAENYPNAEECRLIAQHYGLNPVDLLVLFGLLDVEDVRRYAERYLASKDADRYGQPMVATPLTIGEIATSTHTDDSEV